MDRNAALPYNSSAMNTLSPYPLVLLHGFPLDNTLWQAQVNGLKDRAQVIAPDLRGFGSDAREVPSVLGMDIFAQDLKDLLDARGFGRAHLCGLSMGGYIAFAFLERWPERVASLILANTRATADDEAGRKAREETAVNALERGMAVLARGMMPKLLTDRTRAEDPALAARVERMIARQSPEATAAAARGMALRKDRMQELPNIHVPTTIITGDSDVLMPLETSQAMADAIPGSTLVVLPHAAHLSNVEAPDAFNAAITEHLQRYSTINR